MTLQEFLSNCSEWQKSGNATAGLKACDQVLASGARGRLRAAALRFRAVFLLTSSHGWAPEAVGLLKEALDLSKNHPADQAPILVALVGAYSLFGSCEYARPYADRLLVMAATIDDATIQQYVPKAWFNLGYAYETAREYSEAADAYRRALEAALLQPAAFNPGMPAHNLVHVYLQLGQVDDALLMLQESKVHLSMEQDGSFMKSQEARCYLALGHLEEAEAACREGLAHPSCTKRVRAEILVTLAAVVQAQGDIDEAMTLADQAQDIALLLPNPRLVHKIEELQQALRVREEVPEP